MRTVTYRLPWPPSTNHYVRAGKGNFYLPAKVGRFRAEVAEIVGNPPRLAGRLAMLLELAAPCRRKRDIGNFEKETTDALAAAGVMINDAQIDELILRRLPVEPPGFVDVTITEVAPCPA